MATLFTDDFESYASGSFPIANWQDAGQVASDGNGPPPNPSTKIGITTDAFGQPTRALHLDASWIGASSGVYRGVSTASHYILSFDVRTDAFAQASQYEPVDWAWAMSVGQYSDDVHPNAWDSLQLYGSDLGEDFRAYAISEEDAFEEDLPLGLQFVIGEWYHIQMDVGTETGTHLVYTCLSINSPHH